MPSRAWAVYAASGGTPQHDDGGTAPHAAYGIPRREGNVSLPFRGHRQVGCIDPALRMPSTVVESRNSSLLERLFGGLGGRL